MYNGSIQVRLNLVKGHFQHYGQLVAISRLSMGDGTHYG